MHCPCVQAMNPHYTSRIRALFGTESRWNRATQINAFLLRFSLVLLLLVCTLHFYRAVVTCSVAKRSNLQCVICMSTRHSEEIEIEIVGCVSDPKRRPSRARHLQTPHGASDPHRGGGGLNQKGVFTVPFGTFDLTRFCVFFGRFCAAGECVGGELGREGWERGSWW